MPKASVLSSIKIRPAEFEHTLQVSTVSGTAQLMLRQKNRSFEVLEFEVTGKPELCLAFPPKGPGIENLDFTSDAYQCFNVSVSIRFNGMPLSAEEMRASSLEELCQALGQLKLRTFNGEEI